MEPDKGNIEVFGKDILKCRERELQQIRWKIGYLFQEGALYDSMTIRENLLFPARRNPRLRKLPENELNELVDYNLESVELIDAANKLPAELSGGMKKRAGLARTLMLSPDLIIYDEPTTGLDPYTAEAINNLILKVREKYNTSALIITQDIKCARMTGDRLIMLNEGRILAEGSYEELSKNSSEEIRFFFN